MNYLLQLVAFRKRRMLVPISPNAILLYHTLLEYGNEVGFPERFTAANSVLVQRTGLTLQPFERARKMLIQNGYITYKKGSGNHCGQYMFTNLAIVYNTQNDIPGDKQPDKQPDKQCDTKPNIQPDTKVIRNAITLTKQYQNESKQNKTNINRNSLSSNLSGGKESLLFFDAFWNDYPKKQAKSEALKAFLKLSPDKELLDRMLEAIKLFSKSDNWKCDNGQYIPLPATWLNGKRWEDEAVTVKFSAMSDGKEGCPY